MVEFKIYDDESAPEETKEILKRTKKGTGFIPNMHGIMAGAPVLLKAYKKIGRIFSESSFTDVEQEIIEMTINQVNGCTYCIAAHSYFDKLSNFPEDILLQLLENKPLQDSKFESLRLFTKLVVEKRGEVTQEEIEKFISAGYSKKHILELIVGVAHKIMSNYLNHIAETPIDKQFK